VTTPGIDRVALITGAARGIGAATVHALVERGYRVVALDSCAGEGKNRPPGIDYALAEEHELHALADAFAGQVVAEVVDVRDRGALAAAAERAVQHFGRLDAVVAAAAVIAGGRPMWETPQDQLASLWDVDVFGVWNTAAACVPLMLAGPEPEGCRFVAVSSSAGTHGLFNLAAYNVAKHAVVGLVRGLAADLVGTGVTATAVAPGSTRTQLLQATAELYGELDIEQFGNSHLVRRLLDPKEVAETIAFCCSVAGVVLNGSVVCADGGFSP